MPCCVSSFFSSILFVNINVYTDRWTVILYGSPRPTSSPCFHHVLELVEVIVWIIRNYILRPPCKSRSVSSLSCIVCCHAMCWYSFVNGSCKENKVPYDFYTKPFRKSGIILTNISVSKLQTENNLTKNWKLYFYIEIGGIWEMVECAALIQMIMKPPPPSTSPRKCKISIMKWRRDIYRNKPIFITKYQFVNAPDFGQLALCVLYIFP